MRGRFLAAVIILCIVFAAFWETKRRLYSPVIPLVTPPVAHEIPYAPAPKMTPSTISKKPSLQKKTSELSPTSVAPVAHTTPLVMPLPLPYVPPTPLAPEPQEWKGNNDTSITHAGQIVVQNDNQWIRFWSEHHPHEAAPEVDFSQRMVVGVFLGRRPADGFRVDITDVRSLPDAVVVDYYERAPPPGTFQVAVEAFPYDIKTIPRSALHVKFNQLTAQYQPSPYQKVLPSTGTK